MGKPVPLRQHYISYFDLETNRDYVFLHFSYDNTSNNGYLKENENLIKGILMIIIAS